MNDDSMNADETGDRSPEAAETAFGRLPPHQDMSKSPLTVETTILTPAWLERLSAPEALAATTLEAALSEANAAGLTEAFAGLGEKPVPEGRSWEVSVALGDDALLRRLNRDYRGQDKATNVLAFPAVNRADAGPEALTNESAPEVSLGDIVLALETVTHEAAAQGKSLENHLCHLLVHGFLHLLGQDHQNPAEAEAMEALEVVVLARLGIADPYRAVMDPKAARPEAATS
jgi:probable rRNA maturation factor